MAEFFRGWKRKVGVVTLVMACAFTVGWMRSIVTPDYVRIFPHKFHGVLLASIPHNIRVQVWAGKRDRSNSRSGRRKPRRDYQPERFGIHLNERLTRREWVGSAMATIFLPEMAELKIFSDVVIPYWIVVLPLALLSAWLLLSKPRRAQKPPANKSAGE